MWGREYLRSDMESVLDPAGFHCVYLYTRVSLCLFVYWRTHEQSQVFFSPRNNSLLGRTCWTIISFSDPPTGALYSI